MSSTSLVARFLNQADEENVPVGLGNFDTSEMRSINSEVAVTSKVSSSSDGEAPHFDDFEFDETNANDIAHQQKLVAEAKLVIDDNLRKWRKQIEPSCVSAVFGATSTGEVPNITRHHTECCCEDVRLFPRRPDAELCKLPLPPLPVSNHRVKKLIALFDKQ